LERLIRLKMEFNEKINSESDSSKLEKSVIKQNFLKCRNKKVRFVDEIEEIKVESYKKFNKSLEIESVEIGKKSLDSILDVDRVCIIY
jgi:hypothetical protein